MPSVKHSQRPSPNSERDPNKFFLPNSFEDVADVLKSPNTYMALFEHYSDYRLQNGIERLHRKITHIRI